MKQGRFYLDLNHWTMLARAATGHVEGTRFVPVLMPAARRATTVV